MVRDKSDCSLVALTDQKMFTFCEAFIDVHMFSSQSRAHQKHGADISNHNAALNMPARYMRIERRWNGFIRSVNSNGERIDTCGLRC
jgi:hypothetical protein